MKIACLECGQLFSMLQSHITRTHKITTDEYREKHGKDTPFLSDDVLKLKKENGYSPWSISDRMSRGESEEDAKLALKKKRAETFGSHTSVFSEIFWINKGYSKEEAEAEMAKRRCSLENLIKKYGEEEGKRRYIEQYTKSGISNSKQAMLDRGYSESQIRTMRDNFSIPSIMEKQEVDEETAIKIREGRLINSSSHWTLKYWTDLGYSVDVAKERLSEIQRRDLPFFINKYGDVDGKIRYNSWVKDATSRSVGKFASKESVEYFKPLIDWCSENGYSVETEKYVRIDTKAYYLDLVIPELMLVFEYDGEAFHADPEVIDESWVSAKGGYSYWDSIAEDDMKTNIVQSLGYKVIRIHSSRKNQFNLTEIVKSHEKINKC